MEPKPSKVEPLSLPPTQLSLYPDSETGESWSLLFPVTLAGPWEHNPVYLCGCVEQRGAWPNIYAQ